MGCQGRPLFDLNELPTEGNDESGSVLHLQPQRVRPSLNSHAADLFAPPEGGQRIVNSSAFSHEPSVSGFQPFVRPKGEHVDGHVKQHTSNHVNPIVASSSKIVDQIEKKKETPLLASVPTPSYAGGADREEGEWSDGEVSMDAFQSRPSGIDNKGLRTGKLGPEIKQKMTQTSSVPTSERFPESSSHDMKHMQGHKDELIDTVKGDTPASVRLDSQRSDWQHTISDGSVKGDTSMNGQEESSLSMKQRGVKGVEAIPALKSTNSHRKKHKIDHHKEAMLGKKRSRQTMFLNLEEIKQAGTLKSSTPRRQPVSSTSTSRTVKEIRTIPAVADRNLEKHGHPTTSDPKLTDVPSSGGTTTMEYGDYKPDSNGDMSLGVQSRINSVYDISSDVQPPTVPRQGSLKQPIDLRQQKVPPLLSRKQSMVGQSSEHMKAGNKKPPPVKKQPINNTQYNDSSIERLLREVTNEKFWHHPENMGITG